MAKITIRTWDEMYYDYTHYHELKGPDGLLLHPDAKPSVPRTLDDFISWMSGAQMDYYPKFPVKIGEVYALDEQSKLHPEMKVLPKPRTVA
jgi:hypothetical protein